MTRLNIHELRKDEIVQVATTLVAQKGWQNTTLADIARAANISLGVITYHFSSKDELINTVMEKYVGESLTEIYQTLDQYTDHTEKLRNLIRLILSTTKEHKEISYVHFDYWGKISWNKEIREMNAQFYDYARNWTADCIKAGIKAGVFKKMPPREAATIINGLLIGLQAQHVFDEGAFDFEQVLKMAEKTVMNFLLI